MASDHARHSPRVSRWGRAPSIRGPEDALERRTRTAVAVTSETDALGAALERVVFLECRTDQLTAELELRGSELARAQEESARAAARESERTREVARLDAAGQALRAEVAELSRRLGAAESARAEAEARGAAHALAEEEISRLHAELEEQRLRTAARERDVSAAQARATALEHAVERIFQRLIDWQAGAPGGSPDLAGFIAELRSEIVGLQRNRDEARTREAALRSALERAGVDAEKVAPPEEPQARPSLPSRLHVSPRDVDDALAGLPTDAERRLARQLVRELDAGPAALRSRAALRLTQLAGRHAAPALAAAAGSCADRQARAALVDALGRTAEPRALELCRRFLADPSAEVRGAAVEACARLADGEARDGILREGVADLDPRVRRRAVLAAASLRGVDPGPLVAPLCQDPEPQVRRVACAALAGTRDAAAASALVSALGDPDAGVRAAAAAASSRMLGEPLQHLVDLPAMARDRQIARLRASLEFRPLGAASVPVPPRPPQHGAALPRERHEEPEHGDAAILGVVRGALRGATPEEIAAELGEGPGLARALERLVHQGLLVRRGRKLYLP